MKKYLLSILLVCLYLYLSVNSIFGESLTIDEIVHVEEGLNAWYRHTFAVDVLNPPFVREIATIPLLFGARGYVAPRLVIVLFGFPLLWAVYQTVKKRIGKAAALMSVFLLVFEPNMLANNHYVTLDFGFTVILFLTYVLFLSLIEKPVILRWMMVGASLGFALASKVSALLFLPPLFFLALLVHKKGRTVPFVLQYWRHMFMSLVIALLVLWATYFFRTDTIIAKRDDASRVSSRLHEVARLTNNQLLEKVLLFGENVQLPLGNYMAVLKNSVLFGKNPKSVFFMGEYHMTQKWYFLPVTMLYKTPVPLLLLFVASAYLFVKKKCRDTLWITFFLPIPVMMAISMMSSVRPMVRYMLPVFPFIVITAAQSIPLWKTRFQKILFVILCLWYAWGTVSESPHFIAYTNELAGPRHLRYEKFFDSNLDWGQSLPDMKKFMKDTAPSHVLFSYFGRDDGDRYGLSSDRPYGSYKSEEICAFHEIKRPTHNGGSYTIISITNWYECGYYKTEEFAKPKISNVVASFLVFNGITENKE